MSLAKYLFIAAREDAPALSTKNVAVFFQHVLERIDPSRDLHFQTNTTMDTLDYSGSGLNAGSKVVIAVAGEKRRDLARALPTNLRLSEPFQAPRLAMPGVLVVQGPAHAPGNTDASALAQALAASNEPSLPLVVLCDDSEFCARNLANFLWVTFTRSNPAVDIRGVHEFVENKAWGCRGSIVIDARCKSHHAPALVEDPTVTRRVDALVQRTPELKKLGL
jgi:4-hydroxy-3-polyprenylbenzoate decarboxylase